MEGLASAILEKAVAILASVIGDQLMMQWNLKDDMEDMKNKLDMIWKTLEDADGRSIKDKEEQEWLRRLKNAFYDISDMLDDFQDGKRTGLLSYAPNITLANKKRKMRQELTEIHKDHKRFRFSPDSGSNSEEQIIVQRETTSAEDEEILGREEEKKEIIELLLERNTKEGTIIVPITGLGGIGKTTLARLVFNDTHFIQYDHRVWVYVSEVFDLKKIGKSIISRVSDQGSQDLNDQESINQRLKEILRCKKDESGKVIDLKTLIVLDDLWEEKNTELGKLKTMLNVGNEGCMIDVIVTTREEEIAKNIRTGKSYDLKPLDDTMCWNIIKKRCNFESRHDKEQLEQIGQDIAIKCAGIALAAGALGYTLSEMDLEGWSAVRDSDIWNEPLIQSPEDIHSVLPSLMLSYKRMPFYLKLCFAYCAIFPKGQNIGKYDLIYQWIALDFIKPSTETFSATQVGEKYITQLLGMSFLHHSNLSSNTQGRGVYFSMHDLVHDLARSVMTDELLLSDAEKGSNSSRNKYCRYALLTNYSGPTKLSAIVPAQVRALRFLDCWELRDDAFKFAKFLRVLDLSGCELSKLPKSVTRLSRLQCLNLHGSWGITALPESIGKMECLMYLDLSETGLKELPESIGKIERLMHFDLSDCHNLKELPESIGKIVRMMHLNLSGCSRLAELPESIGEIERLMHLNLSGCSSLVELPESISKIESVIHLDLSGCYSLKELPESIGEIERLMHLDLSGCSSLVELPESISKIESVIHLDLSGCYSLKELPESFWNLKTLVYLNISSCYKLEELPEDIGKLHNLVHLDLSGNTQLNYLPESLGNLKRLHTLDVSGCSGELKEHMTHSPILRKFVQLALFMVHANDVNTGGNLHQLEDINPTELKICSLENVRFPEEARTVKLFEKQNLSKLTFEWDKDARRLLEDKDVLEELVPPSGLEELVLQGYSSIELPTWLMGIMRSPPYLDASHHLPNVVEITLDNLPRCNNLPPLGQLPNLEKLRLMGLCSIAKIGEDLCGGSGAFRRLSEFILEDMERLEEWSTTYNSGNDGMEFMFPKLQTLWTSICHSLRLKPCPPIFSRWHIYESDKVISSWSEGDHISISSSTPAYRLEVHSSKVPKDKWRLLHHIPALQEFEIHNCDYLTSLPESMRHHTSLRSLDLNDCNSIWALPEWMGDLTSLESLKIRNCQSMKSLPQCVQQLTMLKTLHIWKNYELKKWCESEENKIKLAQITDMTYGDCDRGDSQCKNNSVSLHLVMVSDVNTCGKLHQLEEVNLNELKISCLENVSSLEEAHEVRLLDRQSLSQLTLEWTSDDRFLDDKDVLGELVPPRGLQYLELDGYSSISFPTWLMGISHYLPSLAKINLKNLPRCSDLPPLGQLPNLEELHLERLHGITKIDGDFCGGKGAFLQLSTFTLRGMKQLEEWNTTYCREDGVVEFMFPKLDTLEIKNCPKLRLTPCPPIFCTWIVWNSDEVISSWSEGEHISHSPSDTQGTMLDVWYSKVPVGKWKLLHHLPTLQELRLYHCDYLPSLPESMWHLVSLRSLELDRCNGISALPEWLGHLPSLEILHIYECRSIKSLPQCIQQLTKLKELRIRKGPELKKWCESNENKMKLAHIENIRYE